MTEIEHQKEQKQKKKKDQEEKSTLQRSKTFVNLLFKAGRKKDASRGRSKSPGDKPGKGGADVCDPPRPPARPHSFRLLRIQSGKRSRRPIPRCWAWWRTWPAGC